MPNDDPQSDALPGLQAAVPAEIINQVAQQTDTSPETVRNVVRSVEEFERLHVGPLPPPDYLAGYERACPGSAKTIIDMAVSAQRHSQTMEGTALRSEVIYRLVGIIAAAFVLVVMVIGAVIAAIYGNTAGTVTLALAAGIASVVGVFVRGRNLFGKGADSRNADADGVQPSDSNGSGEEDVKNAQ